MRLKLRKNGLANVNIEANGTVVIGPPGDVFPGGNASELPSEDRPVPTKPFDCCAKRCSPCPARTCGLLGDYEHVERMMGYHGIEIDETVP